jgi:hypothetical protein
VNAGTDRSTDQTVTKEAFRLSTLRRLIRLVSLPFSAPTTPAERDDTATAAAAMASDRPSEARTQGGGVAAPPTRLRTQHRAVSIAASVVAVLGAGAFLSASPAQAASPWWQLSSGARPTHIQVGSRQNQVQEILTTPGEYEGNPVTNFVLTVEGESSEFATEPVAAEFGLPLPTAANIQSALEGSYGVGNVSVTEETLAQGAMRYLVTNVGETADLLVPRITVRKEIGTVEAKLVAAGRPDGEVVVTAENLGDAPVDGEAAPVTVTDNLPPGLEAIAISATAPSASGASNARSFFPCSANLGALSCTFSGESPTGRPLAPYDLLEVRIGVRVRSGAHAGEENQAKITGGAAPSVSTSAPLSLASPGEPTPFGVEDFRYSLEEAGGAPATRAGSHPFQFTTTVALNQGRAEAAINSDRPETPPAALAKDVITKFPPGFVGNPTNFPTCSLAQFLTNVEGGNRNACPADTALGVASVSVYEPGLGTLILSQPLFNIEPYFGEPARFGFYIAIASLPVVLDTSVRSGAGEGALPGQSEDYGLDVDSTNITQTGALTSARVTVWGTPGDPSHGASRGWGCLASSKGLHQGAPCTPVDENHPPAFLTAPTSCAGPLQASVEVDPWIQPGTFEDALPSQALPALDACNQLPFGPTIDSEPTTAAATSPTGLNFDLNVKNEGLTNSEGLAAAELKKAVITLPQGFTTNPSVAEGLKACSLGEYDATTIETGVGCTEESKIGSVEIESPVVTQKVKGSLFVAKQGENPNHNLLTIYMVLKNAELGVLIKQALKVVPDPVTGQLTTEVDDIPQLPFSHFRLSFRQGQRSPLVTPPACGTYTTQATLYSYAEPDTPSHEQSSFQITQGPEGQGCPGGGLPPFHPNLEAGTTNNAAGTYSPFYTHITRKDSEQEITRFSIKLPTGLIAKLKGVSECSDAAIAQAKSREVEGGGTVEQEHPSCPSGSEVGHTLVGSGVGNVLAYAPGKLYLAGPYHGSPISLVSITAAKVGPFDLGTVVVRFALDVNHETAEVSVDGANSDPIPHIVDGIPIHLRDLRAYVDRPGFALNPTSCAKKSTAATILGSGLNFASSSDDVPVTVSSPFQAADCASLGFAPKLALSLVGKKTHRGALPAFKAVLTYPKGGNYANIAAAQVTLPESEYLEQGHLKDVCTRKVFETGATPGENCPPKSIYGHARATTPLLEAPLEGPVYLRTGYGTKLPELAAALNGPQISITLAGKIDSVHKKGTEGSRIRNTFAMVPDAPVEKFTLELKGGKKGLLVNSTDVCKGTHKALAAFTGQNGKLDEYEPALKAQCGKGKKKSGAKKNKSAKGKGGK